MAIFRGTGGSGNSTDDSIVSAVTEQAGIATTKASEAASSATTATTKASEASASANTATTKASEASVSATSAENQKLLCIDLKNDTLDLAQDALASANAAEASAQTANNTHVQTVSGIATEVQNLDSIKTDITGVNTIKSDVTTVAGISSNVTTVAADASDIGTVATNIANVNNVGDNIANVNAVHSNASNINTVAADGTDIGTVASNISNVNTVAGISSDVTTVAGLESKMDTVIADASDIGAVAGNISDVTTVAGINADVDTVAGIAAKVTTVADNISDVQSADTNAANASASASQAANSATAASNSATTASTKATEASNSATAASNSATTATTKATEAAGSATTATTKATEASTSATNAATSATTATTKASEAASSATSASGSATTATTKASEADASATSAASSATDSSNAASTWTNYYSTYLGAADAPPTADVQGNALQTGAFYYDTGAGSNTVGLYVYNGSSWVYSTNYNNVTAPYSLAQDLATNSNDISFGDNAKANFGASDDLQIYHNGSNSYIRDVGTGNLNIDATNFNLRTGGGNEIYLSATTNGAVGLRYDNAEKLSTTSTGIDVTGTAVTYGVKSIDNLELEADHDNNSSAQYSNVIIKTDGSEKMRIDSTGRVGIGTTSPSSKLTVSGDSDTNSKITVARTGTTTGTNILGYNYIGTFANSELRLFTNSTEKMRIDSSGNVGIGTNSPDKLLDLESSINPTVRLSSSKSGSFTANEVMSSLEFHSADTSGVGAGVRSAIRSLATDTFGSRTELTFSVTGVSSDTEAMRIDSDGNVGIGTNSPATELHVEDATGNAVVQIEASANGFSGVYFGDVNDGDVGQIRYDHSDNSMRFGTNANTERMRIDSSGNVGIGTSSPVSIGGHTGVLTLHGDNATAIVLKDNVSRKDIRLDDGNLSVRNSAGESHLMVTDGGNVGIGTTSPAFQFHLYNSITGAAQVEGGSRADIFLVDSGSATDQKRQTLRSNDGNFIIGTENDARTAFTEKMRIDSSGNVLVGKTSSSFNTAGVEFASSGRARFTRDSANVIEINRTTNGNGSLVTFNKDGTTAGSIGVNGSGIYLNSVATGYLSHNGTRMFNWDASQFYPQVNGAKDLGHSSYRWRDLHLSGGIKGSTLTFSGNGSSEHARIDSSGNLLVGKTSNSINTAGGQLNADGLLVATRDGGNTAVFNRKTSDGDIVQFRKDNTTVGSIGVLGSRPFFASTNCGIRLGAADLLPATSSGVISDNVVSLGSSSGRWKDLYLSKRVYSGNPSNTAGNLFLHIDGNADGVSTGYKIRSGVGVSTGSYHIAFVNPNGVVGTIQTNGSATSYNTSSDERLKENIQDADDAGSKIDAIQVRQFDWIIDGTHESYGVIAQELQSVAPEAVSGNPESEEMMGVDYSKLVPTLIKEIQTLRNRVAQLENN